jgi:hypothetical protein
MGLKGVEDILTSLGLSQLDYDKLNKDSRFIELLEVFRSDWANSLNTASRNQVETAIAFEQGLPYLFARIIDRSEPLNHVTEAMKLLADVAGLKKQPQIGGQQEKFKIIINLGEDHKMEYSTPPLIEEKPTL